MIRSNGIYIRILLIIESKLDRFYNLMGFNGIKWNLNGTKLNLTGIYQAIMGVEWDSLQ